MNENIDLTKILKDCPEGWTFWSKVHGEITFKQIRKENYGYPIEIRISSNLTWQLLPNGKLVDTGECIIVPSKDQQDWSKFSAPWYKKDKFDPKTLKPYDRILVKNNGVWFPTFFVFYNEMDKVCICAAFGVYEYCIPYNDETKHLVGTKGEAPEYYRYWED